MVPEKEGAYGNARIGTTEKFSWETAGNLNLQTLSIEIEGYAHNIHETMPRGSSQWVSLIRLIAHRCKALGFPVERSFGHKQVATNRSDPGALRLDWIVYDVNLLLDSIEEEDDMTEKQWNTIQQQITELKDVSNNVQKQILELLAILKGFELPDQSDLNHNESILGLLDALFERIDTMPTINLSDEDLQTIAQYVNDNHPNMIPAI